MGGIVGGRDVEAALCPRSPAGGSQSRRLRETADVNQATPAQPEARPIPRQAPREEEKAAPSKPRFQLPSSAKRRGIAPQSAGRHRGPRQFRRPATGGGAAEGKSTGGQRPHSREGLSGRRRRLGNDHRQPRGRDDGPHLRTHLPQLGQTGDDRDRYFRDGQMETVAGRRCSTIWRTTSV